LSVTTQRCSGAAPIFPTILVADLLLNQSLSSSLAFLRFLPVFAAVSSGCGSFALAFVAGDALGVVAITLLEALALLLLLPVALTCTSSERIRNWN